MSLADIFVGTAAIAVGTLILAAGALNWQGAFHVPKVRFLANRLGRRGARIVLGLLGLALIGIGCAIIAGFAPLAERRSSQRGKSPRETGGGITLTQPG